MSRQGRFGARVRARSGRVPVTRALVVLAVLLSCTGDGLFRAAGTHIDIQAVLAPNQATTEIAIDRVRAEVIRPPDQVIASETLSVQPGQDFVELGLRVTLQAEQEQLLIRVGMWTGELLRYRGEVSMLVDARQSSNQSPTISLEAVAAVLELSTGPVLLAGLVGGPAVTETITVRNAGGELLNWSATTNQPWLTVAPGSGALAADASAALTVSAAVADLSPGVHLANITVAAPGAAGAPAVVPVEVRVETGQGFVVSPTALSFTTLQGSDPSPGSFVVTNGTSSPVSWSASDDATWLTVSPAAGTLAAGASQDVTAEVSSTGLQPGQYGGTITLVPAGSPARTIAVNLNVTSPGPAAIGVSPNALTFTTQQGTTATPRLVGIANTGATALSWSATADAPWLLVSPESGTVAPGGNQSVTVNASAVGLTPGTYNASITVSDPLASNSPQTVAVSLTVTALPTFTLAVTGAGTGQGTVLNTSGISCDIVAGTTSGDCSASYPQGTSVTLDVIPAPTSTFTGWSGACSGTGACQVLMDQARTVTATFALIPSSIALSPDPIVFTAQTGTVPAAQPLQIGNTGGAVLNWSAATNAPWLSVVPNTGTIPGPGQLAVSVNATAASLVPGSYNATITVSDPAATNSPQTVAVQMTVTAVPTYTLTVAGAGSGLGAVTDGGGISCNILDGVATGDCTEVYTSGTEVTLEAIETSNTQFVGWSGACTGTGDCLVTMDQDATVTAEFVDTTPVELIVVPGSLDFTADEATNPAVQFVDITASGNQLGVSWTASSDAEWLGVTPAAGSLSGTDVQSLAVTVTSDTLSPGNYAGTLTFSSPDVVNSPQTVSVTLTVNASGQPPTISNPSAQLLQLNDAATCTAFSPPGSFFQYTLDYTDPDGDINETASWFIEFEYDGDTVEPSGSLAGAAQVTGDGFSGQASVYLCLYFGASTSVTHYFYLYDAEGNESNVVELTTSRPDGGNSADVAVARPARTILVVPPITRESAYSSTPRPMPPSRSLTVSTWQAKAFEDLTPDTRAFVGVISTPAPAAAVHIVGANAKGRTLDRR